MQFGNEKLNETVNFHSGIEEAITVTGMETKNHLCSVLFGDLLDGLSICYSGAIGSAADL